jgi:hypothetical protein
MTRNILQYEYEKALRYIMQCEASGQEHSKAYWEGRATALKLAIDLVG